jgi:hypothetical protein
MSIRLQDMGRIEKWRLENNWTICSSTKGNPRKVFRTAKLPEFDEKTIELVVLSFDPLISDSDTTCAI